MGARTLGARNGMHMPGARSVLRAKNASVPTPIDLTCVGFLQASTIFKQDANKRGSLTSHI